MSLVDVAVADGVRARGAAAARRRARGRLRAPDRPGDRARGRARARRPAGRRGLREPRGPRRRGRRRRPARRGRPPALLAELGDAPAAELDAARRAAEAPGQTAVAAAWDGARAACSSSPTPSSRPRPRRSRSLQALGLRPVLLTGDNEATARAVAAEVGIDEVIAEVLPADKADVVRRLQAEGRVVAMVGDGVNDAPALAQADLGLAIGTGTDVAIEASDLTLVSGDLRAAADAIRLSRATLRTIKQNLGWAFGYNVAALPLAAAGLPEPGDRRGRGGDHAMVAPVEDGRREHDGRRRSTRVAYTGVAPSAVRGPRRRRPWTRTGRVDHTHATRTTAALRPAKDPTSHPVGQTSAPGHAGPTKRRQEWDA